MRILISAALALALAGQAAAQTFGRLYYSTAAPSGDLKDYIDQFSWRGITFESGRYVRDNVTAAVSLGWTVFNQKTDQAVSIGDAAAAQGTQFRYVNAFPVMAQLQVHRQPNRGADMYLGLNGGVYYIERKTDVSVVSLVSDNWHFGLAPQAGIIFPMGYGRSAGSIDVRYNHAFDAGGRSYSWWTFSVGFAYGRLY